MADDIMQLWSEYVVQNSQGIDVGVGVISLCNNHTCFANDADQPTSKSSDTKVPAYSIAIITTLCVIFTGEYTVTLWK